MPTNVALLHNAKAGDETFTRRKLVALLRRAGFRAKYFPLKRAADDEKALRHGEFVVVAGGDGSVRKIALRLAGTKRAIAPLPLGTANNIARSLGLPTDPAQVVAGWKNPVRRRIDVGVAKGPWGKKHFIEGLGLGLVGRTMAVLEDIDEHSGRAFSSTEDKLHRDLCVMAALALEMPGTDVRMANGKEKRVDEFLLVEVLNISRAGPGMELADEADPGDGMLDVVSATVGERKKLTREIEKCLAESRRGPLLRARKVRRLRLAVDECEVRLDDKVVLRREDFARLKHRRAKIEIGVKPGALEFVLPGETSGQGPVAKKRRARA